jgi:acyl carrier protein
MSEQEILEKVKEMVASQLGKSEGEITLEASFIEDLGADSLDLVELIMSMEDEYGLEISDEDAEKIVTVKDAVKFILENKK